MTISHCAFDLQTPVARASLPSEHASSRLDLETFQSGLGRSRPGLHPLDADIRRRTQTICQLSRMMLNVSNAYDLMLEFGHLIPAESTRWIIEIQCVDSIINQVITNFPVCQHLSPRIGFRN